MGLKKHIVSCIVLFIICFIVFFNSLDASFIWDDNMLIVENEYITSFKMIPFLFSLKYWREYAPEVRGWYRPIRMVTFIFDYFFWKLNPFGYHLTNFLLHSFCVILIYFLIFKISSLAGIYYNNGYFFKAPFLTAFLFAVYPIHTESVVWIKNRSDLLTLIFFISALLFFIGFINNKKFSFYFFSIFFYIMALFSKEMAFMIPVVLLSYCFFFNKQKLKSTLFTIPFFIIGILYFYFGRFFLASKDSVERLNLDIYTHFFVIIKTIGYYIRLSIFPFRLCAEIPFNFSSSFFDKDVFISLILLLIIFFLFFKFKKFKLSTFGLLWFFITLIPASNIILLEGRPIAEQRLYIPSLGYCLLVAILLEKMFMSKKYIIKRIGFFGFISLFGIYSGITIRRNFDFKNPVRFFERTAQQSGSWRVFYNLGNQYFFNKQYNKAIASYEKTIELNPYFEEAYVNLSTLYQKVGNLQDAINILYKGLERSKSSFEILFNLGNIYKSIGDFNKALECLNEAMKINPNFVLLYDTIGNIYYALKDKNKALEFYREAVKKNPYYAPAYNNMGVVLLEMNRVGEAILSYQKALDLRPDYTFALYNLGIIYLRIPDKRREGIDILSKIKSFSIKDAKIFLNIGIEFRKINEIPLAIDFFKKALDLNPFLPQVYYNLGEIYTELKRYESAIINYQKMLELNLASPLVYNRLADIYNRVGNYNASIFFSNKAIELKPDYQDAYINLAIAKYKLGLFQEAIDSYKKILEISPYRGDIYYNIGIIYYEIKNFKLALEYLNRAVELSYDVDAKILEEIKCHLK